VSSGATPLQEILRLNTRLLLNCLDGVSDDAARRRVEAANPLAFLATHLIDSRHFIAGYLGAPLDNPFAARLAGAKGVEDLDELPALDEIRSAWLAIGGHLDRLLPLIPGERWGAPSPERFPVDDASVLGGLAFLVQHDSYHVGQAALLRRQLCLPAMSYARRP
jgi:hypothetical protein